MVNNGLLLGNQVTHSDTTYFLVDVIYSSEYSTVFKAARRKGSRYSTRPNILKVNNQLDDLGETQAYEIALREEAETLERLTSPFVVGFEDYFEFEGQGVLVMENISYGSLKNFVDKHFTRTTEYVNYALRAAYHLAQALSYVHSRGELHRDLKPGNILFGDDELKLTDFLPKSLIDFYDDDGALHGTAKFIAPEIYANKQTSLISSSRFKPRTQKSDIYALGVTLYYLFTNKLPFEGEKDIDVLINRLDTEPIDPREHNILLPEPLSNMILRCIEKDEDHRQTLSEILSTLQSI